MQGSFARAPRRGADRAQSDGPAQVTDLRRPTARSGRRRVCSNSAVGSLASGPTGSGKTNHVQPACSATIDRRRPHELNGHDSPARADASNHLGGAAPSRPAVLRKMRCATNLWSLHRKHGARCWRRMFAPATRLRQADALIDQFRSAMCRQNAASDFTARLVELRWLSLGAFPSCSTNPVPCPPKLVGESAAVKD